jgi:hypothetical protein
LPTDADLAAKAGTANCEVARASFVDHVDTPTAAVAAETS